MKDKLLMKMKKLKYKTETKFTPPEPKSKHPTPQDRTFRFRFYEDQTVYYSAYIDAEDEDEAKELFYAGDYDSESYDISYGEAQLEVIEEV